MKEWGRSILSAYSTELHECKSKNEIPVASWTSDWQHNNQHSKFLHYIYAKLRKLLWARLQITHYHAWMMRLTRHIPELLCHPRWLNNYSCGQSSQFYYTNYKINYMLTLTDKDSYILLDMDKFSSGSEQVCLFVLKLVTTIAWSCTCTTFNDPLSTNTHKGLLFPCHGICSCISTDDINTARLTVWWILPDVALFSYLMGLDYLTMDKYWNS